MTVKEWEQALDKVLKSNEKLEKQGRVSIGERYYSVVLGLQGDIAITHNTEHDSDIDNKLFKLGNYFVDEWEATEKLEEIKEILKYNHFEPDPNYENIFTFIDVDKMEYIIDEYGFAMSDFSVDKINGTYHVGLEAAYFFKNTQSECEYLEKSLKCFEKYMTDKGLDINDRYVLFMSNFSDNMSDRTLEGLYTKYKIWVNGYLSTYSKDKGGV